MSQLSDPMILVSPVGSIWFLHDTTRQVVDLKPNGRSLRDEPSGVLKRAPVVTTGAVNVG